MSDTPRTDSARHDEHDPYMAIASECSKLERELNAANARIKRMEEFVGRFLDPEDLGWAIGKYDRNEARKALGKEMVESKAKEAKP